MQPPATIREAEGEEDEFIKALGRNKSREASNASLSAAAAATAAAAAASNESDDNQRHESVVSFDEQVELKRPAADAPPVALSDEKTEGERFCCGRRLARHSLSACSLSYKRP